MNTLRLHQKARADQMLTFRTVPLLRCILLVVSAVRKTAFNSLPSDHSRRCHPKKVLIFLLASPPNVFFSIIAR